MQYKYLISIKVHILVEKVFSANIHLCNKGINLFAAKGSERSKKKFETFFVQVFCDPLLVARFRFNILDGKLVFFSVPNVITTEPSSLCCKTVLVPLMFH